MANGPMDRRAFGEQPQRPSGPGMGRGAEYTGRYVVLLDQGNQESGLNALRSSAGIASVERVRGAEPGNVTEL
ncbi:protease, partial [Streptomyces sp. ISL-14]|nr:protease [Streptomyces sp. ISL-14]